MKSELDSYADAGEAARQIIEDVFGPGSTSLDEVFCQRIASLITEREAQVWEKAIATVRALRGVDQSSESRIGTYSRTDVSLKVYSDEGEAEECYLCAEQSATINISEPLVRRADAAAIARSWENEKHVNPARYIAAAIEAMEPWKGGEYVDYEFSRT